MQTPIRISTKSEIAVVHNGITENYLELKEMLLDKGYQFRSETDTEVMAHLLRDNYDGDMLTQSCGRWIMGGMPLAILFKDEPEQIYSTQDSQLIVGQCAHGRKLLAIGYSAILEYTRDVYLMDEHEIAKMTPNSVSFYDLTVRSMKRNPRPTGM